MAEETTDNTETTEERGPRNVYITGGATPLGLSLTKSLVDAGHTIAVCVSTSNGANAVRAVGGLPVYGDADSPSLVADNLRLSEADTVLNLAPAAVITPPVGRRDWATVAQSLKLETAALDIALGKVDSVDTLLHISPALVYAQSDSTVSEDAPLADDADNAYVAAAVEAEHTLAAHSPITLRIGYLFGTSEADPVHTFEKTLQRTLTPSYFGTADAAANWLRTEDLASAVLAALENAEAGTTYNIAADDHPSVHDFLGMLADKLGLSLPSNLPRPVARATFGKDYVTLVNHAAPVDSTRAHEDLNWTPRFKSVDAALEDMLLSWRARV